MATIPYQFISGTFNGLTFYVVNGRQLVRTKTSINQQRFNTDPAFEKLRQYSEWLKLASPMASKIYRQLPPQKGLQQRLTGRLIQWLKKGVPLAVAVQRLVNAYLPQPIAKPSVPTHAAVALWPNIPMPTVADGHKTINTPTAMPRRGIHRPGIT
ncbi:MAG: hypothetical protein EKK39_13010 [Sphingobacteriales bacterium]|uniref:hypothetical protein n=1 Tax=Hydrotalea flava TaxID=714549 RepID=UPI000829956C|nr:hypothetical protein [Hydrotalea flava]RTL47969.1 MAG: hypothetical protein EKK39_13010 [Sphingobacteriales bacterium]